jgi:XTP/dITP diphosphohydrolase
VREVVLATRSPGKLRELAPLFAAAGITALSLDDLGEPERPAEDDIEVFSTFEENAAAKARYFFARLGVPVVADDSGLEVTALGGEPGVRSKRWSGRVDLAGLALDEANNAELARRLAGVRDRSARYVCVAWWIDASGERMARGESAGSILESPAGDGGFGYDPWFRSEDLGCTFAEADLEQKEAVSHRGRAFRALLQQLGAGR